MCVSVCVSMCVYWEHRKSERDRDCTTAFVRDVRCRRGLVEEVTTSCLRRRRGDSNGCLTVNTHIFLTHTHTHTHAWTVLCSLWAVLCHHLDVCVRVSVCVSVCVVRTWRFECHHLPVPLSHQPMCFCFLN